MMGPVIRFCPVALHYNSRPPYLIAQEGILSGLTGSPAIAATTINNIAHTAYFTRASALLSKNLRAKTTHNGRVRASTQQVISTRNVIPRPCKPPSVLMWAPICLAAEATMASPSPDPETFGWLPRWKRSKSLFFSEAPIPGPSSATNTCSAWSARPAAGTTCRSPGC